MYLFRRSFVYGKDSYLRFLLQNRSAFECLLRTEFLKALQMGEASKVVPIDKLSVVITLVLAFVFLHEEFTAKSLIGCVLIGAGTLIMVI